MRIVLFILIAALSVQPAAAQSTRPARPLHTVVTDDVQPTLARLIERLLQEQRALTIDGTPAFNGGDKFLPGKIAIGMSHLIVETPATDPARARYLAGFRDLAELTLADANETWGTYYYLAALVKLQRAGLLEQAVRPATLATLRRQLDWRPFVALPAYTLINLPTNYYGVAFSVARLRYLLGWEDASASDTLLARTVAHYQQYSGAYGFSDETDGEGRFDRYSILLIGEICQRFIETGLPVTPQLRTWLRGSVDVLLPRLTFTGEGIDFGRSIGPYGETAFLEVLSAAAVLGVLTPEERGMAYSFSVKVAERYATFWYDSTMQSVNLWERGRRTDGYRGKHRILGENLSLVHQILYTTRLWDSLGYTTRLPRADYRQWLDGRPRTRLTWFARGANDRALLTVHDRQRIFSLPIINGGAGQHAHSPYFAIPFSPGLVVGVAEATFPLLTPAITLAPIGRDSARVLMPLAYQRDIARRDAGDTVEVTWRQDALDWIGSRAPRADSSFTVRTRYRFRPGRIEREDRYTPRGTVAVQGIRLEYAVPGTAATVAGTVVRFTGSAASRLTVTGLDRCRTVPEAETPVLQSNVGPLSVRIRCESGSRSVAEPLVVRWLLEYR